jgi:hypothetical protein
VERTGATRSSSAFCATRRNPDDAGAAAGELLLWFAENPADSDNGARGKRIVRSLEVADDVDKEFVREITERRAELRSQREDLQRQLAEVEYEVRYVPNPASPRANFREGFGERCHAFHGK